MNPERWQRIEDLFLACRDLDADARAERLARECGDDEELRREVETMLAAAAAEPDFLETAPTARAHEPAGSAESDGFQRPAATALRRKRIPIAIATLLIALAAIALFRFAHPRGDPDAALALEELGDRARDRGQLDSARVYYEEALRMRTATQGEEGEEVAATLDDLAIIAGSAGRKEESIRLFGRALDVRRRALGPDHPAIADGLDNLARLHGLGGDLDEAERLYREALEIRTRVLGADDPATAQSWSSLGALLEAGNDFADAERAHREAMRIRIATRGEADPGVTESVAAIAGIAARSGRIDDAVRLLRDRLGRLEDAPDAQADDVTRVVIQLSEILTVARRFPEAETLLLDRLDWSRRAGQVRHRMVLAQALEGLYQAWDRPDRAARFGELSRDTSR